jgi:hypothetical protein
MIYLHGAKLTKWPKVPIAVVKRGIWYIEKLDKKIGCKACFIHRRIQATQRWERCGLTLSK